MIGSDAQPIGHLCRDFGLLRSLPWLAPARPAARSLNLPGDIGAQSNALAMGIHYVSHVQVTEVLKGKVQVPVGDLRRFGPVCKPWKHGQKAGHFRRLWLEDANTRIGMLLLCWEQLLARLNDTEGLTTWPKESVFGQVWRHLVEHMDQLGKELTEGS